MSEVKKSFFACWGLSKSWSDCKVLDNIDLNIEKAKIVSILGPSGTGKSTLLRIIAGLEDADQGQIYIEGQCINNTKAENRPVVMMFQQPLLFPQMKVIDNVTYALRVGKKNKVDKRLISDKGNELLGKLGMAELATRYPHELSGGQQQRVALARALAAEPKLLLLDEPFASLDADLRSQVRDWVQEVLRSLGVTTLFVTHDREEAMLMGDEIVILNNSKILQQGKPLEVYQNPCSSYVAEFFCDGLVFANNKFIASNKLKLTSKNHINCKDEHVLLENTNKIFIDAMVQAEFVKHGQRFVKLEIFKQACPGEEDISKKSLILAYEEELVGLLSIGKVIYVEADRRDILKLN